MEIAWHQKLSEYSIPKVPQASQTLAMWLAKSDVLELNSSGANLSRAIFQLRQIDPNIHSMRGKKKKNHQRASLCRVVEMTFAVEISGKEMGLT